MDICPICGKELVYREWYDHVLVEWMYKCNDCNYMERWYYGSIEYVVGKWRINVKKYYGKSKRLFVEAKKKFKIAIEEEKIKYRLKKGENYVGRQDGDDKRLEPDEW